MDEKGKQEMVMIVKKEKEVNFSEVVEDYGAGGGCESYKKKRLALTSHDGGGGGGGGEGGIRCCQVEKCEVDLREAKAYHKRHKVCESHAKAQFVIVAGVRQRFCQQCSRFHELSEFDDSKRSCRRRLAGHNERRRKNSSEPHTQGSTRKGTSTQLKDIPCGKVDDLERGRIGIPIQESSTYKHFQIR